MVTINDLRDGMEGKSDHEPYCFCIEFQTIKTVGDMRTHLESLRPDDLVVIEVRRKSTVWPGVNEIVAEFGSE